MHFDELELDQVVRIIEWEHDRPDHWASEMDEWCGEVVTISDLITETEEIYIMEDEGEWTWYASDFEPYQRLSEDNPNVRYRRVLHERRVAEWRKIAQQNKKKKSEGAKREREERKKAQFAWAYGSRYGLSD